jgi:asparagine synthetase B (glutamine-hydrolysing)
LPSEVIDIPLSERKQSHRNLASNAAISNEGAMTLRESLRTAVETRSDGHKTVAISLSGGVDSAIIAILAAELNLQCETFSAHWSDSDKNRYNTDSQLAQGISKSLGLTIAK